MTAKAKVSLRKSEIKDKVLGASNKVNLYDSENDMAASGQKQGVFVIQKNYNDYTIQLRIK